LSLDFTDLLNDSVYFAITGNSSADTMQFELYPHITLSSCRTWTWL